MNIIRFAKTRRQDFRSSFLGGTVPAKTQPTGLEHLEAIQKAEAATHDKWVNDLGIDTLQAIWNDLAGRPCWDKRNPEHRWTMGRRAAVGRRLAAIAMS